MILIDEELRFWGPTSSIVLFNGAIFSGDNEFLVCIRLLCWDYWGRPPCL